MANQTCGNCTANLPEAPPGSVVVCPSCGKRTTIANPPFSFGLHETTPVKRSGAGSALAIVAVAVLLVLLLVGGAVAFLVVRVGPDRPAPSISTGHAPVVIMSSPGDLSALGKAGVTKLESVDASGMSGKPPLFDAVANVPWATSLAQTWSSDARLASLRVRGIGKSGRVNVGGAGSGEVRYEFRSRARHDERATSPDPSSAPWGTMELVLESGTVRAAALAHDPGDVDVPKLGCSAERLLEIWRDHGLPDKDTYEIALRRDAAAGWVWTSGGVPAMSASCTVVADGHTPGASAPPAPPEVTPPPATTATRESARLNFNSIPPSKVLLDGRPIGTTPIAGLAAAPGTHQVVFVHAEKGSKTVSVSVKPEETKTVAVRF